MVEESSEPTYEYSRWEKAWKTNELDWHIDHVHPTMKQYFHELTAGHGDEESLRIFVPLCGKSVDMLWLAEQGHEVVGVELVQTAIETFFTENNLSFTTEDVEVAGGPKATFYRCTNKEGTNISILQCDIFSATDKMLGGKFHAVWERGSLVAIDPADRVKYVAVLKSVLGPNGRLLFGDAVRYDQSKYDFDGPAYSVSEEQLNSLFLESFCIRELAVEKDKFGRDQYCYLLTLK